MNQQLSPYRQHVLRWHKGCGADECSRATRICIARGQVPCQVLFVGEASGPSEDVIGQPFVGPAGQLLDEIIRQSLPEGTRYALTNLVCCIPRDEQGNKAMEPSDDQVRSCSGRLQDFVRVAQPELIVCVGKLAREWLDPMYKHGIRFDRNIPQVHITHPAGILRSNVAMQGLMFQRCVVTIQNAIEDLLGS